MLFQLSRISPSCGRTFKSVPLAKPIRCALYTPCVRDAPRVKVLHRTRIFGKGGMVKIDHTGKSFTWAAVGFLASVCFFRRDGVHGQNYYRTAV